MKTITISSIILFSLTLALNAQTAYNWPCAPFDQQHNINGTFCENRPSDDILIHHFHSGVDIHLPQGSNVYSVINGNITSLGYAADYGINAYVRVGRYAYVHVDPSPSVQVGTPVTAYQTVIGATNSWNHIHFKDGYSGYETDAIRPDGGLTPLDDTYPPYIEGIGFFVNGTTIRFPDNRVSGLVEIVAKASDKTDNGPLGSNNGIHAIGYQIYDASGTTALTDSIQNFKFTGIPSNSYVTNVFFTGSDISNYFYTITNQVTRDGYWDTRFYDPGTYKVKVFTDDSKMNSTVDWVTVVVVPQDIYPPADPKLLALTGNDNNQWLLNWLPNDSADVAGYNLYFSYTGQDWFHQPDISGQINAADTTLLWDGFSNNKTIYFRLSAYDQAAIPNTSDLSDAYGVRLSATGPQVLIVDGFDRTDGYWNYSAHQYAVNYGRILSELNLSFNTCSDDAIIDQSVSLSDYETVIYILGDESGEPPALSQAEQTALADYLNSGGNLIISGSEIGYDLVKLGSASDSLFFADYLKANHVSDSSTSHIIQGVDGSPFSDLITEIAAPEGRILRADVISPIGSDPWFAFADSRIAAIHFNGLLYQNGTNANLVYFSFPFELITDQNIQSIILGRTFEIFGVSTSIASSNELKTPAEFMLYDNYPNPFNPRTQIRFSLHRARHTIFEIYSIEGRKIKTLYNEYLSAGEHRVTWDGTDASGQKVSSGVYIYRLRISGFEQSRKMVLLR